jgi:DNA-binding FadR family transcriptional regulator
LTNAAEESTDLIVTADVRFHRALFAATHNELLEQLGMMVEIGLGARDDYVHGHRVSIKLGMDRHREVAEAIRDRNGERAAVSMRSLLEEAAHDVRRLQRRGPR